MRANGKRAALSKGLAAAIAVAVLPPILYWIWPDGKSDDGNAPTALPSQSAQSDKSAPWPRIALPHPDATARRARLSPEKPFTPEEVIRNPVCRFRDGRGNAAGLGLVLIPGERGARFEVLDGEGAVLGGSVPFWPNHYRLARSADGSIITGFGDLRLNSGVSRPKDTPEPVRIFRGGQLIYETDKAWNFGLAPDGSAFFVLEPEADSTSRLVIRNLDMGTERDYDLGYEYTPAGFGLPYSLQFTARSGEVMMAPAFMSGGRSHFFFPADGERQRKVTLDSDDHDGYVAFESMRHGYFAFSQGEDQPWLILKKEFHWGAPREAPKTTDVWAREIVMEHFYGNIGLSNDAAWLMLRSWQEYVLDTRTGDLAFYWPKTRSDEELARLSTVLPPEATIEDAGGVQSVSITDGQLRLYRRVKRSPTQGSYYFDVFDMAGIGIHSKPQFRVHVDRDIPCMAGDFVFRGLQVADGALTYLAQVRQTR